MSVVVPTDAGAVSADCVGAGTGGDGCGCTNNQTRAEKCPLASS